MHLLARPRRLSAAAEDPRPSKPQPNSTAGQ
jgi:hypothetical protein